MHKNSLVTMDDGTEREIKFIKSGCRVKSYEESTGRFVDVSVIRIGVDPKEGLKMLDWYKLELDNNRVLVCTEDQLIRTTRGFVSAKDILVNSRMVSIDDRHFVVILLQKTCLTEKFDDYVLYLQGKNFICERIIVHDGIHAY